MWDVFQLTSVSSFQSCFIRKKAEDKVKENIDSVKRAANWVMLYLFRLRTREGSEVSVGLRAGPGPGPHWEYLLKIIANQIFVFFFAF